jgi:hypothetical protein
MADVKWSNNAKFPPQVHINPTDTVVGLSGGGNVKYTSAIMQTTGAVASGDIPIYGADGSNAKSSGTNIGVSKDATGFKSVSVTQDPVSALQLTTKQYVDAKVPALTKGQLITNNGTTNVALPINTDGFVLTLDSTQPDGIKWSFNESSAVQLQEVFVSTKGNGGGDGTIVNPFATDAQALAFIGSSATSTTPYAIVYDAGNYSFPTLFMEPWIYRTTLNNGPVNITVASTVVVFDSASFVGITASTGIFGVNFTAALFSNTVFATGATATVNIVGCTFSGSNSCSGSSTSTYNLNLINNTFTGTSNFQGVTTLNSVGNTYNGVTVQSDNGPSTAKFKNELSFGALSILNTSLLNTLIFSAINSARPSSITFNTFGSSITASFDSSTYVTPVNSGSFTVVPIRTTPAEAVSVALTPVNFTFSPAGDHSVEASIKGIDNALGGLGNSSVDFSAYQSPQQTIPHNAITQIQPWIDNFDNGSYFNVTTGTYTPLVTGTYTFTFQGGWAAPGSANATVTFYIYQNGVSVAQTVATLIPIGTFVAIAPITVELEMNGTTDYVQVFAKQVQASGSAGLPLGNVPSQFYFVGALINQKGVLNTLPSTITNNQYLLSVNSSTPVWSTATLPPTTTINQLLYSSSANTIVGLATANSGVLVTSAGGIPSISSTLPAGLTIPGYQTTLTLPLSLANGGTNANLTASNGGIFYSTATAGAILAGTATAGQMLRSGSSAAPTWSTATWPTTTTANQLLYSSATNTVAGLATGNNAVIATNGSGVPSAQTNFYMSSSNLVLGPNAGTSAIFTGGVASVVAIGPNALSNTVALDNFNTAVGESALLNVNGGIENTGVGYGAGGDIHTGNTNSCFGQNSQAGAAAAINRQVFGSNAVGSANNQVMLGDSNVTTIVSGSIAGQVAIGTTSTPYKELVLGTASTNNIKITPASQAAARVYTVPDVGANSNFVLANVVTSNASLTMAIDTTYYMTNTVAGPVWTLPATSNQGDRVAARVNNNSGIFKIGQNSGQTIIFGSLTTLSGVSGYIQSLGNGGESVVLECITANTVWQVVNSEGSFNLVDGSGNINVVNASSWNQDHTGVLKIGNASTANIVGFSTTGGQYLGSAANPFGFLYLGSSSNYVPFNVTTQTTNGQQINVPDLGTQPQSFLVGNTTEVVGTSASITKWGEFFANNASLVTLTLPTTAAQGDKYRIRGKGAGGWNIAQNAGQLIHFDGQVTATGTGGSIASAGQFSEITIECMTANTTFCVVAYVGNFTLTT